LKSYRLLSAPGLIWYLAFILAPVIWIGILSFQTRGVYGGYVWQTSYENYSSILGSNFLFIFWRSFWLALQTGLITVSIGVIISWALVSVRESLRPWLLSLVILPFLINLVIRIYAIRSFVGYDGPLQAILRGIGLSFDPFAFTSNDWLVYFGMVTTYLPFTILPLYSAMGRFDLSLFEAAQDLGASVNKAFAKVVLPNLKIPLLNAFILVFIPALGEYVIPDLLGGAKNMYLGNLVTEQFLKARDWPAGSALAIVLIFVLCLSLLILNRIQKKEEAP
jgi:spermidine/putrescine transport system permease protein